MNKYQKYHYYNGKSGGLYIPHTRSIEETKYADNSNYKYVGTFREYTPLARTRTHFDNDLVLEIRKSTSKSKTDFTFSPVIPACGSYHGSGFNNNGGFRIPKQLLQEIVNHMDDADELIITAPDTLNRQGFDEIIREIKEGK